MKATLISLLLCLVIVGPVAAQSPEAETLKGLTKLSVLVEALDEESQDGGLLTEQQLLTDVQLKLRQNGITVVTGTTAPYIYVNLNAMRLSGVFVFNVSVSLQQQALLANGVVYAAATWHKARLASKLVANYPSGVRSNVSDMLDMFLNDYLSVNPKK